MKLNIQISIFVLLTFTMSTVFAMTFTTTQSGGNSSKDITVQVGKQYQLKFDLQHQTTNNVRVQIIEGSAVIVDASYLLDGSHVYSFTPTSNTVTLIFIREDNDNVSRDFEVNNLVYEEVLSTIQAESNHVIGRKEYELADHLGNVRAVISDKPKNGNAEVISATDYLPFGMTARTYSNGSVVRYGYSGKEKENEISEGDYDFGARIYNVKIGKWLSIDPEYKIYPSSSVYVFVQNCPISFIDKDGAIIGNPNHPDALRLQAALEQTDVGKVVWQAMVNSDRTINIIIATPEGDEVRKEISSYLNSESADGVTMTEGMFNSACKGEDMSKVTEAAWTFNSQTGEYDKTAEWNTTYIVIKEEALITQGGLLGLVNYSGDEEKGKTEAMIVIGGEEALHSLQNYADFAQKEQDGAGVYQECDVSVPYADRRHEKEAKAGVKYFMQLEYKEANTTKIPETTIETTDEEK